MANVFIEKIILLAIVVSIFIQSPIIACDDTLVMLLTAKNPTSEFSKSIRSFMYSLTLLGTTLKYNPEKDYTAALKATLDSWLEFSKKYMTNPPEEAKNDRQWREKMSNTARKVGTIRKLINEKKYSEAHNGVLELSNTVGSFFESVGITDEKQIFISTSADLNDLQRLAEISSIKEAEDKISKLRQDLEAFKKYLAPDDNIAASSTAMLIDSVHQAITKNENLKEKDTKIGELRTSFEELRSRILLQEWFATDKDND